MITCKQAAELFERDGDKNSFSDNERAVRYAQAALLEAFGDIPLPDSVLIAYYHILSYDQQKDK